jgi:hypothetical protein
MIQETARDALKSTRGAGDDVLAALGLERRRKGWERTLSAVGYVMTGALIGSGVALLFAPKPGREVRKEIGGKMRGARQQTLATAQHLASGEDGRLKERQGASNASFGS